MTTSNQDQPATTAGPCNDATVVLPPLTESALELAWSADPDDDHDGEPTWGDALAQAALPLFAVAVVAFIIVIGCWAWGAGSGDNPIPDSVSQTYPIPATMRAAALPPISSEPAPSPAAQTPVAALPPSVTVTVTETPQAAAQPAPKASTPGADQVFRNFVLQIPGMRVVNWGIAQAGAHNICAYLGQGHSHDDAAQQVLQNDPTFTPWQASAMVNASTAAYCPQLGG